MKYSKIIKLVLSGIMCIALIVSLGMTGFAVEPSEITFGKSFKFEPGTNDLFTEYKRLIPGDSKTQQIKINNKSSDSANFYLSIAAAEQNKNLSQAEQDLIWDLIYNKIQIKIKDVNGKEIYNGSIGGDKNSSMVPDEITDGTFFMGEVPANTSKEITVELEIDESIGNEYQGLSGNINWIFTAEQNGSSEDIVIEEGKVPLGGIPSIGGLIINTNDPANMAMWASIIACSVGLVIFVEVKRRKAKGTA